MSGRQGRNAPDATNNVNSGSGRPDPAYGADADGAGGATDPLNTLNSTNNYDGIGNNNNNFNNNGDGNGNMRNNSASDEDVSVASTGASGDHDGQHEEAAETSSSATVESEKRDSVRPSLGDTYNSAANSKKPGHTKNKSSLSNMVDPELMNFRVEPTPMEEVRKDEEDQATEDTLDPWARWLRIIGFTFSKKVPQPGKGEKVELIQLRVPFTTSFVKSQAKNGSMSRTSNTTHTAKYNIWTFVPQAAGYQFLRFTNAFYLFIAIIALVGYYGDNLWTVSFNPVTIIALLIIVVGVALIFEGMDDLRRHRGDRETNNRAVARIRNGELEETNWGKLLPGDLVVVNDRESVPADMILLASYGADQKGSTCYIETSGIDGETNLKMKEVPKYMTASLLQNTEVAESLKSSRLLSKRMSSYMSAPEYQTHEKERLARIIPTIATGLYEYEQPNVFMQFNATFVPRSKLNQSGQADSDGDKQSLDFKNLILRGSQLRNTKWIIGLVAYAGPETKLALSRRASPAKFGRIDLFMNRILLIVTVLMCILIIVADVILFTDVQDTADFWYFQNTSSTEIFNTPGPLAYLFTYLILLSNMIPIPIIIIVEILNFYAQAMIMWDIQMYHEESDTAASCRTSNLVAEIGQITHVFSDKTGTLTRNQMKMVGCWVDGNMYGHQPPPPDQSEMDDAAKGSDDPAAPKSFNADDKKALESVLEEAAESQENGPEDVTMNPNLKQVSSDDHFADLEIGAPSGGFDDGSDLDSDSGSEASLKSIDVLEVFEGAIQMLKEEQTTDEHRALMDFFVMLAVCHTVVLDFDENGNPVLNAESPDEEAFVKAAGICGVDLQSTSDGRIVIKTPHGEDEYKVLAVNPFNSSRKRMSLVLNRTSDNSIVLMMKGADNKMLERLAAGQDAKVKELNDALTAYSWNGLRTLVMGKRELTPDEYEDWHRTYKAALVAKSGERGAALAKAAELVENNVMLVGASAIEDQLQLGVPESIRTLRDAGCQVWVLTGDKVETAINIGLSSNLLDSKMLQLKLISDDVVRLEEQLDEILEVLQHATQGVDMQWDRYEESKAIKNHFNSEKQGATNAENNAGASRCATFLRGFAAPFISFRKFCHNLLHASSTNSEFQAHVALVVSGVSLELLLHKQKGNVQLEEKLLRVARACKVVLACRVSPAQKSLIVEMVRFAPDVKSLQRPPVTLAIGDGANDVPMIQAAHVGVGISGMEGRQAVNSSDFAIGQFRYLVRLMLVHGRWTYRRQANVINYVVYSWVIYTGLLFMYLPFSLWSGEQIFYETIFTSFFAYFANVCEVAHGWFDRDLTPETILRNPWVYGVGVNSSDLNYTSLMQLVLRSAVHIVLLYGFLFCVLPVSVPLETLGSGMYLGLIMVLYTRQALIGSTFTNITVLVFVLDLACFFIVMASVSTPSVIYTAEAGANMLWTSVVLCVLSVIVLDITVRTISKEFFPHPGQVLQELDRGYFKGNKHARHSHQDAIRVLEEFGRLTALPFSVGVQRISQAVEKREGNKRAKDLANSGTDSQYDKVERSLSAPVSSPFLKTRTSEESSVGDYRQHAMAHRAQSALSQSSAFQKMAPAFDYDFSTFGEDVRSGLRRIGRVHKSNSTSASAPAAPRTEEPFNNDDYEDDENDDNDAYETSARRFDLQKFLPFARKKQPLDEIKEDEDAANRAATGAREQAKTSESASTAKKNQ